MRTVAGVAALNAVLPPGCKGETAADKETSARNSLVGHRFLTFNSVIRVNQIEVTRTRNEGFDEYDRHTPANVRTLREALAEGWPGAPMTWAFSWRALHDEREHYTTLRRLMPEFHDRYGDDVTFIPGAYFANAYNTREQVNRDLHDGLVRVSDIMGGGFRPKSVIAGFLAADNQKYLSQEEGIQVCQGNIWSQYAVDNQDGEGSICYPYYPSREHFCKPAQSRVDFIDCVNLDGWTWVTNCWEISLVPQIGHLEILTAWTRAIRERWPMSQCLLLGNLGRIWREANRNNDGLDYRFRQRGTGIGGSDAELEIRWFMNKDFRLALLRNWRENQREHVIDFTRYDLPAREPRELSRNWSLMNRLNQKGIRPQDRPVSFEKLPEEDQRIILARYPDEGWGGRE